MRLSTLETSPYFHDVVYYVAIVTVNNIPVKACIEFDTVANTATCIKFDEDGTIAVKNDEVETYTITGQVNWTWRHANENYMPIFLALKKDWEAKNAKAN